MTMPVLSERQHHPVIANLVVGVRTNQNFIADKVAPAFDIGGGLEFEYDLVDNSAMVPEKPEDAHRGLRGETRSIDQPEEGTKKDSVREWALKAEIDINETEADRGRDRANPAPAGRMSHEERRMKRLAHKLYYNLKVLKEQATAAKTFTLNAFDAALRDPNPANFAGSANILEMFLDAGRLVQRKWGVRPDTLTLGWDAMVDLIAKNSVIRDLVSGGATVTDPALVDLSLLARAFKVAQVVVGEAVIQTLAVPGKAGAPTDLWKPNAASLTYTGFIGVDEDGDPDFGEVDESSPAFAKRAFRNVPDTSVPLDVMTYQSPNGKITYVEATEYWKVFRCAAENTGGAGFFWDNTNAA